MKVYVIWHKIFYLHIQKSFQSDEELHLFHCNSILCCWVIQGFAWFIQIKWLVTSQCGHKMIKITKYGISVSILSLQDWNFARLMYWKNYTLQYCLWCNHSNKLFIRPLPSQKILICCSNGLTHFLVFVLCDILLSLFAHTHWMNSTCKYNNTFWKRKTLILP